MHWLEYVLIAKNSLWLNPLRSLLALIGIIIGVASVVTILAIGNGAHDQISRQLRSLGTNLLYVYPQSDNESGTPIKLAGRHALTEADASAIASEIPGVEISAPMISDNAQLVYGNNNWSSLVVGTTPEFLDARNWKLEAGRSLDHEDISGAKKVAVIGKTVAKRLFGDGSPVGATIRSNNVPLKVTGILQHKGQDPFGWDQDDVVYTPLSTAKLRIIGHALEGNRQAVALILVRVANESEIDTVAAGIGQLLNQRHGIAPGSSSNFSVENMEALIAQRDNTARTLTLQLAALASVSLLVGGIAIMNIMIVTMTERTREIGLRMAVGARRRDIHRQFLAEALALCLAGGVLGAALGIVMAWLFSQLGQWPIVISLNSLVLAIGASALAGLLFGLYPAYKASRLDPIAALRHD